MSNSAKTNMSKGIKVIILIAIIAVIILAVTLTVLIRVKPNEKSEEESVGTEWGDKYLVYFKKEKDSLVEHGASNYKIKFIQPNKEENPVMVVKYTIDNNPDGKYQYAFRYIDGNLVLGESWADSVDNVEIVMLYDKETGEYKWYEKKITSDSIVYTDLEKKLELHRMTNGVEDPSAVMDSKEYKEKEAASTITFNRDEMPKEEINDTTPISKFEERFIEIENLSQINIIEIESINDLNELKNKMKELIANYKNRDAVVTEEIKQIVTDKITNIENRKKAIKEAEEKAILEENAKKKAEEAKGLKVGNYTLKYGKYTGTDGQYEVGGAVNWNVTLTIKSDGTYTFVSTNQQMQPNSSGTYKITNLAGMTGIKLSSGMFYGAISNNKLQVPAGSGATLTYAGN